MERTTRPRLWLLVGVGVATVAVVGTAFVLVGRSAPPPSCIPSAPPGLSGQPDYIMASCGTVADLGSHSVVSYQVPRLSDGEWVEGSYSANLTAGGATWLFILNSTEFSGLPTDPSSPPSTAFWSASPGPVGNFSVQVPGSPAQFYVVLVNSGSPGFSVRWTAALVMYYVQPRTTR